MEVTKTYDPEEPFRPYEITIKVKDGVEDELITRLFSQVITIPEELCTEDTERAHLTGIMKKVHMTLCDK